jgi:CelD/BcsL family acetyltransferase involved in cellulose biosynthesis
MKGKAINQDHFLIKIIQNYDDFEKMKDIWNYMAEQSKYYVPWIRWEWFNLCIKYFLKANELYILLLYRDNILVTIAPFWRRQEIFRGVMNVRKIEFIGNTYSPIKFFLFKDMHDQERQDNLIEIFSYLKKQKEWDVIELDSIPEEKNNFANLKHAVDKKYLKHKEFFCFGDWYLDRINYSYADYFNRLPRNRKQEIERRKRRLEELGAIEFRVGKDRDKLDYYLDIYHKIRDKSWKANEADQNFLKEFREFTIDQNWLRFGFLFLGDQPIAAQIRMVVNNTAYLLSTVYDPEFKKYSPGLILLAEMFKYFIDLEEVQEIDNLKGDEPYKKEWLPARRERRGILIFNNNVKGNLLAFIVLSMLPVFEKYGVLRSVKKRISGLLKRSSYSK